MFSTIPVDGDTSLLPNSVLIVEVSATALRSLSTTLTCVVPESSSWFHLAPYAVTFRVRSSLVMDLSSALNVGDNMSFRAAVMSGVAESGSPKFIRMANACLNASAVLCVPSVPADANGRSYPSKNSMICATAAPPELGGGMPMSSTPMALATIGSKILGRYAARSEDSITPPASLISFASASASSPVRSTLGPSFATRRSVAASRVLAHVSPSKSGDPSALRKTSFVTGNFARSSAISAISRARSLPTSKPSASAAAGSTSRRQGSRPCLSHARCKPASSAGTATAAPPNVLDLFAPFEPLPSTYISLYAAAGADSLKSIASVVPFARRITMNAPPPTPLECGWVTPRHSAVAIEASTAWPPSSSTAAPIALHRASSAATAPNVVDTCSSAADRGAALGGEVSEPDLGEEATAMIATKRMTFTTTEAAKTWTARDPSPRRSPRHSRIRRRMLPSRAAISARTRPPV